MSFCTAMLDWEKVIKTDTPTANKCVPVVSTRAKASARPISGATTHSQYDHG